jgi:hypothetical protein
VKTKQFCFFCCGTVILEEMAGEKRGINVSESRGYPVSGSGTASFSSRNTMFATGQNSAPILSTSHSHNLIPKDPFCHIAFHPLHFPDIFSPTFRLFINTFIIYLFIYVFVYVLFTYLTT